MKIAHLLTDEVILGEFGHRLMQRRLELGLTQAELADQAGISKRTVERVEAGASTQTTTMIRMLRVLELLDRMELLVPQAGPSPIELLKQKGRERKRASRRKSTPSGSLWQWGDDA